MFFVLLIKSFLGKCKKYQCNIEKVSNVEPSLKSKKKVVIPIVEDTFTDSFTFKQRHNSFHLLAMPNKCQQHYITVKKYIR